MGRENFEIVPYQAGTKSILPHERTGIWQAKKGKTIVYFGTLMEMALKID